MSDYRIDAAIEAMRAKRKELQHAPLDRIWEDLALVCIAGFLEAQKRSAEDNLRRLSQGGAN